MEPALLCFGTEELEAAREEYIATKPLRVQEWLGAGGGVVLDKVHVDQVDMDGASALHYACVLGDVERVASLVAEGACVNLQTKKRGNAPLHLVAAMHSDGVGERMTECLVKAGARLELKTNKQCSPYHLAMQHKNSRVAALLKAHGADEMSRDALGRAARDVK